MTGARRIVALIVVGSAGVGALLAGPAVAQGRAFDQAAGDQRVAKAGKSSQAAARAYSTKLRKAKREARRALRTCSIADGRLIPLTGFSKQSQRLRKLKARFEATYGGPTERAALRLSLVQTRLTVRRVMKTARWRPVLELFEARSRRHLALKLRRARGMRQLLKDSGKSPIDLVMARRDGRILQYQEVVALCNSGKQHEPQDPAEASEDAERVPA